jgi:hypothetical protein
MTKMDKKKHSGSSVTSTWLVCRRRLSCCLRFSNVILIRKWQMTMVTDIAGQDHCQYRCLPGLTWDKCNILFISSIYNYLGSNKLAISLKWLYISPSQIMPCSKPLPEEAIEQTMAFILLSGYSDIFLISQIVGILSSAYLLPFGRPRVIFFQGIGMSAISQNSLMLFMQFMTVAPVISFLFT